MSVKIIVGDSRQKLALLPDSSVHCVVTSPPYFGLRDYGVDGQVGLEATPDAFVAQMVAVFREVRRVLRDDGTLWLNLGDSYVNAKGQAGGKQPARRLGLRPQDVAIEGLKRKDLIGIPWMVAFALRADGWFLRQDIIWHKPNPMPESVQDRCTKAHEYIFLLSKSARYYFDAEAIKEPRSENPVTLARNNRADEGMVGPAALYGSSFGQSGQGRYDRGGRDGKSKGRGGDTSAGSSANEGREMRDIGIRETRNKRSVWTVATQPFSDAHFATFPPELIEPCIKAGCPRDGTVLDPFGGAGTTGLVADRHGRNAILIELNPKYAEIAKHRIADDAGMFA